ncbi:hypothetical protein PI124_g8061 [Phytophthora idaei]|nr:hypothetical protein PI125_g20096 [Phytophthora idaei]KAG3134091.1 hypothetical protein PI126_g18855 [Phytophthora idaei]KAG3247211.1 hypothetical protein PI124_g8061 [Phytophthora idaei]
MERREHGEDAQPAATTGETGNQDATMTAASRGVKRDSGSTAGQQQATAPTEENWSALSNLRVAVEETAAQTPGRPGSTSSDSNRHKVRRTNSYANPSTPQDDGSFSKSSLSFILDDQAASVAAAGGDIFTHGDKRAAALIARSRSTGDLTGAAQSGRSGRAAKQGADGKRRARRPPSRICKHEGCEQYVVDQGLCVRHGGGKRCQTPGCTSRAKHQGRCWKHGGSTECKVPSCINRAKSRGFCWSHGGGTKCKTDNCEKIAISNGLCWAHGGGKRCAVEGCMRQAYERTDNLCNNHHQERQHGATVAAEGEATEDVAGSTSWHPDDEEKPPAPPADQ